MNEKESNNLEKTKDLSSLDDIFKDTKNVTFEEKGPNKILIAIIIILLVIVVGGIILYFIFEKREDVPIETDETDYKEIINNYGISVEKNVKAYIKQNNELPAWNNASEITGFDSYEIVCDVHNIYNDGSIYLNSCSIDGNKIEYTYGIEKEETKEGKKISVYKVSKDDNYTYLENEVDDSLKVGEVTCKTDSCDYVIAFDKYVFIYEEDSYYIYNYENDSKEFGPFNISDDYIENIISDGNKLYGVYYKDQGVNYIYNVNTSKLLKNINGVFNTEAKLLCKYNYVVFVDLEANNFVNLKTGNVSYTIKEAITDYVEDKKNGILYMLVTDDDYDGFKIYNSNGKKLFSGNTFTIFKLLNDYLIVSNNYQYKVYDYNLNIKTISKTYDMIFDIYDNYVVVLEDNHLKIIDLDENELVTYEDEWNYIDYEFNSDLSGLDTYNNNYGLYIVVEDKNIEEEKTLRYYYIFETKESGVIR